MTNDKTVTMSREQIQRWEWMLDSPPKRQELLSELRALLAAVPAHSDYLASCESAHKGLTIEQAQDVERGIDDLLFAVPVIERQDGSALMKIAADLANRHPLRKLYLVCEHQGRINTDSLHEHLDKCGDLLAGIALDIRRAITSPPAPVAVDADVAHDRAYRNGLQQGYILGVGGHEASYQQMMKQYGDGLHDARLDKVKELNQ